MLPMSLSDSRTCRPHRADRTHWPDWTNRLNRPDWRNRCYRTDWSDWAGCRRYRTHWPHWADRYNRRNGRNWAEHYWANRIDRSHWPDWTEHHWANRSNWRNGGYRCRNYRRYRLYRCNGADRSCKWSLCLWRCVQQCTSDHYALHWNG